jgi:hypothetical protein
MPVVDAPPPLARFIREEINRLIAMGEPGGLLSIMAEAYTLAPDSPPERLCRSLHEALENDWRGLFELGYDPVVVLTPSFTCVFDDEAANPATCIAAEAIELSWGAMLTLYVLRALRNEGPGCTAARHEALEPEATRFAQRVGMGLCQRADEAFAEAFQRAWTLFGQAAAPASC